MYGLKVRGAFLLVVVAVASASSGPSIGLNICKSCCRFPKLACPAICPPCILARGQCPYVYLSLVSCIRPIRSSCSRKIPCPPGQGCCETGCGRHCRSLCPQRCPPGTRCEVKICRPGPLPCVPRSVCKPVTCNRGFSCPSGSWCVVTSKGVVCIPWLRDCKGSSCLPWKA